MGDEGQRQGGGGPAGQNLGEQPARVMFTLRSIVFGVLMCVVVGLAGPYWTFYLHTSTLFLDYSVGGAMFFLFVLVLLFNGVLGVIWPRLGFRPGELVVITAMMLVSGAITTMGLVGYLVPTMTAPYYLADSTNQWARRLWPHIPSWTVPLEEDGGTRSITLFYYGLRDQPEIWSGSWSPSGLWQSGGNLLRVTRAMPWSVWFRPLIFWGIFLMALYGCMISVMTLIRKQWIEHESLSFPIAQVPQELCHSAADPWGRDSILRQKVFWIGWAIPFAACSLIALNGLYPWVPRPRIFMRLRDVGPLTMHIRLSWAVLGFTFLIPNRVALSIWTLNLASFATRSFLLSRGLGMQENLTIYGVAQSPIMAHIGMGAMLVFVGSSLYFARHHLYRALQAAMGRGPEGYGEAEPSTYRTAFIVLAASLAVMTTWLVAAGLPASYALIFLLIAVLIFYGLARVVAQCGISVTISPMIAPGFMTSTFGGENISVAGLSTLAQSWSWCSDIRTSVMSSSIHGMYLSRKNARGLFWSLLAAALITFVVATLFTIWLGYRHGAANLGSWFFIGGPRYTFRWCLTAMERGGGPNVPGLIWTGAGAIMMAVLTLAQRSLFWWPLHPVGFIISSVQWTDHLWFTVMLAWLIKTGIVKAGGNRMFRVGRKFFLGMILGQFSAAGVWAIYDTFTGTMNHSVFWI